MSTSPLILIALFFVLVDELPKSLLLPEVLVFLIHRKIGAIKEVADSVFVQHSIHQDSIGVFLKIDAVITGSATVERVPVTAYLPEATAIEVLQILGKNLELHQQLQLQILRQRRHFGRADFGKDRLKHASTSGGRGRERKTGIPTMPPHPRDHNRN